MALPALPALPGLRINLNSPRPGLDFLMNGFRISALFYLALLAQPGRLAADSAPAAPEAERRDWVGKIKPGERVEVDNPWGDVRVRFGGYADAVEYHAVAQPLSPGAAHLVIAATPIAGGLRISSRVDGGALPAGAKDRVDVTVFVPKGAPLSVRTVRGAIEIRGVKGDVRAETETGEISIRGVDGLLSTRNGQGATAVMLERAAKGTKQSFESTTGDITISFDAAAEPLVTAATSGEISTDVSIEISHHPHEEPSKTATAKVGAGNSAVSIRSKRGNIHIRQREDLRVAPSAPGQPATDSDD